MDAVPAWLRSYVADVLLYIEYERQALPISLLCDSRERARAAKKNGDNPAKSLQSPNGKAQIQHTQELTYEIADQEGRTSMERRISDLTQTLSLVGRALARHRRQENVSSSSGAPSPAGSGSTTPPPIHCPLRVLSHKEVVMRIWVSPNSLIKRMFASMSTAKLHQKLLDLLIDVEQDFPCLSADNVKGLDDPKIACAAR